MTKVFILKLFYTATFHLYTFFEFFLNALEYLKNEFIGFYYACTVKNDFEYVFKQTQNLSKIPTHLTILLGNEEPSYRDLANLVAWSCAAGIQYISLYDHQGVMKMTELKFKAAVRKKMPNYCHMLWHDGENLYKNGITGKKIHIRTLSILDGKQKLVDVTKSLCSYGTSKINMHHLSNLLKTSYQFPDPELGFYCDKNLNLQGYPPWQINTTEFLSIGSHYNLHFHKFLSSLQRYSRSEQRLGK